MTDEDAAHLRLVEAEYFKLQDMIESFDAKALQFKGWSVTVTLAAAATALVTDSLSDRERILVLALAAFGSIAFWLSEAMWKQFQQAFYGRSKQIEKAFREDKLAQLVPLQIGHAWSEAFHRDKFGVFLKAATWPHTFMPHLAVSAFCIGMILWLSAYPLDPAATAPDSRKPAEAGSSRDHITIITPAR